MKTICCACQKVLREDDALDDKDVDIKVSHGYCQECYDKAVAELKQQTSK